MGVSDEDLPTWAKGFFLKIETNRMLGKLLGFEKREEELWKTTDRHEMAEKDEEDIEESLQAFKKYLAEKGGSNLS